MLLVNRNTSETIYQCNEVFMIQEPQELRSYETFYLKN
jgi:hypothetical protein